MTKLYDCFKNDIIKIIDKDIKIPPAAIKPDNVLIFDRIDGMYSLCYNNDKTPVHIAAWTEVEIIGRYEP